jgi:adenosine deaminase
MFHTTLLEEFSSAMETGLSFSDLLAVNRTAFEYAFLPQTTRQDFLARLTPPIAPC